MRFKLVAVACLGGWWACAFAAAADEVVSLRDRLTPDEFERAGLNKLTATELDFLSRRLAGLEAVSPPAPAAPVAPVPSRPPDVPAQAGNPAPAARTVAAPVPAPAPVAAAPVPQPAPPRAAESAEADFGREGWKREEAEKKNEPPKSITSRVSGVFAGWSGRTVFRLENGQVWQQAEPAEFSVHVDSPVVTIERRALGSYFLSIEGYGSRVRVKRVR